MRRAVIIYLAVVLVGFVACASDEDTCTTPSGTSGNCIRIHKCETVVSAARELAGKELFEYLDKLKCGVEADTIKVCCENEQIENDSSTNDTKQEIEEES